MITRAKQRMEFVLSLNPAKLPNSAEVLKRYLSPLMATDPQETSISTGLTTETSDQLELKLYADLRKRGFSVYPRFPVAGVIVDLVIEKDHHAIGIDLIGKDPDTGMALPLDTYRTLGRAGLPIHPLSMVAYEDASAASMNEVMHTYDATDPEHQIKHLGTFKK